MSTVVVDDDNDDNNDVPLVNSMGAGSQVEAQFSSFRTENETLDNEFQKTNRKKIHKVSYYARLKPYYDDLVKSISSESQLLDTMDKLEKLSFDNLQSKKKRKSFDENETTFLGQDNSKASKEKPHKYKYEIYGKKKVQIINHI